MKRQTRLIYIVIAFVCTVLVVVSGLLIFNITQNNKPKGPTVIPKDEDCLYRFGALSDIHIQYPTGKEDFERALQHLENVEGVDFTCIAGDLTASGSTSIEDLMEYKVFVERIAKKTIYEVLGNHENSSFSNNSPLDIVYTGEPLYYSFEQGDDVFIMLGMGSGSGSMFSDEQLNWLHDLLEENRNKRCFVFQHVLREYGAGNGLEDKLHYYDYKTASERSFLIFSDMMRNYPNTIWFHGHSHTTLTADGMYSAVNYERDGGYSVHIPSLVAPRFWDGTTFAEKYEASEGYLVDVYADKIVLYGRDFVSGEYIYIQSLDTTLKEVPANTFSKKVPDGCTYTDSNGSVYRAGEYMPAIALASDEFDDGEYIYKYKHYLTSVGTFAPQNTSSWAVTPKDIGKTSYKPILGIINNDRTAISLRYTYKRCTKLRGVVEINFEPIDYQGCFRDLTAPIILAGNSSLLNEIAETATNGNVRVVQGNVNDIVFKIMVRANNFDEDDNNPHDIKIGESKTLVFKTTFGTELPDDVIVIGSSYTWDPSTGTLVLFNPIGDIEVLVPSYKNLCVIDGDGWITGGRCSSKGADRSDANDNCIVTNYIAVRKGDTVYVQNLTVCGAGGLFSGLKFSDGATIGFYPKDSIHVNNYFVENGVTRFTIDSEDVAFIRICGVLTGSVDNVIVTVNEEIPG